MKLRDSTKLETISGTLCVGQKVLESHGLTWVLTVHKFYQQIQIEEVNMVLKKQLSATSSAFSCTTKVIAVWKLLEGSNWKTFHLLKYLISPMIGIQLFHFCSSFLAQNNHVPIISAVQCSLTQDVPSECFPTPGPHPIAQLQVSQSEYLLKQVHVRVLP